jgi:hypothetical protein
MTNWIASTVFLCITFAMVAIFFPNQLGILTGALFVAVLAALLDKVFRK